MAAAAAPTVVHLRFDAGFKAEALRVVELPEEVIKALDAGRPVVFKSAGEDEDVVVCTERTTYAVQIVESSNMCLLTPSSIPPPMTLDEAGDPERMACAITTSVSSTHVLSVTVPAVHYVKQLLSEHPFGARSATAGLDDEDDDEAMGLQPVSKYTILDLEERVPASSAAIWDALTTFGAIQLDGYWQLLDEVYAEKAFDLILATIASKCDSLDAVDEQLVADSLSQYDARIVRHLLGQYGTETGGEGTKTWAISIPKLVLFRAVQLLRICAPRPMEMTDFMAAWSATLPDQALPLATLFTLRGYVLTSHFGATQHIRLFRAQDLSHDPKTRFAQLFAEKAKWKKEDLEPYLADIITATRKLPDLLLTYTRSSTAADGEREYSAR